MKKIKSAATVSEYYDNYQTDLNSDVYTVLSEVAYDYQDVVTKDDMDVAINYFQDNFWGVSELAASTNLKSVEGMRSLTRSPYSYASDARNCLEGLFKSLNRNSLSQYFDDDVLIDALDTLNNNLAEFKSNYDDGLS